MAESVGGIYYDIEARTQGLVAGQRQVKRSTGQIQGDFGRLEKSGRSLGTSMTRLAGIIAGVFAVGRIRGLIREQMNLMDNLAKTSDALRIQQERLQALQLVADLTGTGADQLATNLERMQRNIGRVAREGGPAEKALADIGVNIKDIIDLSPDKQLEMLANAIGNVENAAVKASIAQDLFGRDGVRMLKLLEQLKDQGLDPVVAELEAMGVALSRVDTAQVEAANDALTRAQLAAGALFQRLAVEASPIIEGLANSFTDAAKESGGFASEAGRAIDFVVEGAAYLADAIRGWQMLIKLVQRGFLQLSKVATTAIATVSESLEGASDGTRLWGSRILQTLADTSAAAQRAVFGKALSEQMQGVGKEARIMEDVLTDAIAVLDKELSELASAPRASQQLREWVQVHREAAYEAAQAAQDAANQVGSPFEFTPDDSAFQEQLARLKRQTETLGLTRLQALDRQYAMERQLLLDAQAAGIESEIGYQERLLELHREYSERRQALTHEETENWKTRLEEVGFSFDQMLNQGIGSIASVAAGFTNARDAARMMAQTVLTQAIGAMIRLGIQAATAQKASAATGAATAAALSASYAPAAAMASLASFGANAAPAQAGIASTLAMSKGLAMGPGRLNGGDVKPGMMYPITEDGRTEMLTMGGKQYLLPGSRGDITSNKDLRGGCTKLNVSMNVVNQAQGVQVKQTGQRMLDDRNAVIDVVVTDLRERGRIHSAMTETSTSGNRI